MARSSAVIIPIVPMSDLFDLEVARTKDGSGPLFLDIAKRPDDLELLLRLASASGDQKRFNVRALPLSGHENKVPWRLPCLVPTLGAKDARRNWTQPFFCTTFNVFPEPELARYASASEVPESISGPFAGKLWGLTMPFSLNLSCGMELEAASMLPPRKEIVAAAGNFVKQVFGGDPFLTAHVRLGDMLAYCKERLRFPLCGSTWESVLPEMARWMADAGVRSAFVAGVADGWDRLGAGVSRQLGDMPPKDNFDASQGIQIVVSATGGNWHMVSVKDTGADPQLRVRVGVRVASDLAAALRDQRLRPSAELVRAAGSDERARKMLGDMAGQIVDQLVLSCGQPFLQTWFSTFGGSAALMRHHMAEHCPDFSAPAPAEDPDDRSTQQAAFEAAGVSFDRLPASVDRKTRPPDRYWAIGCLGRTLPPLGDGTVSTAFFSSIPWRDRLKWKEGEKCHECVGPDHRW
ncbi:hypothetical protein DFJ74DRAFT_688206 [Hyaloraphidium curvatum]|nr:hypothetical protein DFJ74DRAFT_688206 [Hyaloraphidium curvatum]